MINTCSFGSIIIDGKKYTSDLIIFPDGHIADSWRRKNGHILSIDDIKILIETEPETIITGTGASGLMRPENGLEKTLATKGIDFSAAPNRQAIVLYNELVSKKRVGACFHLTC